MTLVDTSVVVDYLRTADPKLASLFRTLPVALCGVTRAEVLHGVRNGATPPTSLFCSMLSFPCPSRTRDGIRWATTLRYCGPVG